MDVFKSEDNNRVDVSNAPPPAGNVHSGGHFMCYWKTLLMYKGILNWFMSL